MKKGICVFLSVMLFVTMLLSGTVLVSAASTEYIKTDKTEYKSGEMVKISYSLDVEESGRFICVYRNGEAIYNNLMYAMSASSLSNEGTLVPSSSVVWTWHGGGPSIMTSRLSAGSYIIKVMYLTGVSTDATAYVEGAKSSFTSTFTVVDNTGSANPTISATKTELEYGEDLEIAFDGVTNELGENTLQIKLENSAGTVTTWNLWDGSTEYAGLNGTVSYTDDLAAGTYTAKLVCSDGAFTLGNSEIQFTVQAAPNTPTPTPTSTPTSTPASTPASTPTNAPANTPTGDTSIWMISILLIVGAVTYFMMKKRCTR